MRGAPVQHLVEWVVLGVAGALLCGDVALAQEDARGANTVPGLASAAEDEVSAGTAQNVCQDPRASLHRRTRLAPVSFA